jgi:hypothetical protein
MGFAAYCRNRVRSADPKFRNDQVYTFFLLLVKEKVELQNCISTYLRQARNTPGLTKQHINDMRYDNLDRYNRSFSVFKKMRGTSSYYEAAKSNLMAMIRQKGAPSLFITLSSAEYQWDSLVKKCYETKHRTECTEEIMQNLSSAEKNKLITECVVQTTCHFQKRIEKITSQFMTPGWLEGEDSSSSPSEDDEEPCYFYRIEFQARGAPHVHMLCWCKDSSYQPCFKDHLGRTGAIRHHFPCILIFNI